MTASGTYPIVEGPVQPRTYTHAALPSTASLPVGTLALDSTNGVMVRNTGAAWVPVDSTGYNVIAPGLHGVVGNADCVGGGTDDAPAIRNYLNSLLTAVPGETISLTAGMMSRTGNVVTITLGGTSVSGARLGSVVNISPGETNFPAGNKVVSGLGFLSGGLNPHVIQYVETGGGGNGTNSITETYGPLRRGSSVYFAPGSYRMSSRVDLAGTFVLNGAGMNTGAGGAIFCVDAGTSAFGVSNAAYGSSMRDFAVVAVGKTPLPNSGPRSGHGATTYIIDSDPGASMTTGGAGSYGLTFNNGGDAAGFHTGDVVQIEGASLAPGTITGLQIQTTATSATISFNNPNQALYVGMYAGMWLKLPGAWTRERILSIDTVAKTAVMASTAAGTLHFGSMGDTNPVVFYPDVVAQIQTGGGTSSISIEDVGICASCQTYMHHFDSGIYASTQIHLENIFVQGFKGCGLVNNGAGSNQPSGFANQSTVSGMQLDFGGCGFYGKGVDSNASSYVNVSADFVDLWGILSEQYGKTTWLTPIAQVGPVGHIVGLSSNQGALYLNPYSEGTTSSFGAGVGVVGDNTFQNSSFGLMANGQFINGTDLAGNQAFVTGVGGSISPSSRGVGTIGVTGGEWGNIWGQIYGGRINDYSAHGAVTVQTNVGETVRFTGDGSAISSLTLALGVRGQMLSLIVTQDAGNTTTWPSTIGNAKLIGGTWTKTTGANKEDNLLFRCDGVVWRQVAPTATNLQ
jgi:hypothetical protein